MEKRRLSKILAKADAAQVRQMAEKIRKQYEVTVIKAPEKSLTMIKMRDPVKETLFLSLIHILRDLHQSDHLLSGTA